MHLHLFAGIHGYMVILSTMRQYVDRLQKVWQFVFSNLIKCSHIAQIAEGSPFKFKESSSTACVALKIAVLYRFLAPYSHGRIAVLCKELK